MDISVSAVLKFTLNAANIYGSSDLSSICTKVSCVPPHLNRSVSTLLEREPCSSSLFMISIIDSHKTHILNFLVEIIFLVMRDVNRDRVTEKLVDLFQGETLGLL